MIVRGGFLRAGEQQCIRINRLGDTVWTSRDLVGAAAPDDSSGTYTFVTSMIALSGCSKYAVAGYDTNDFSRNIVIVFDTNGHVTARRILGDSYSGGSGGRLLNFIGLAPGDSNTLYAIYDFERTARFGFSQRNSYLIKFDQNLNIVWQRISSGIAEDDLRYVGDIPGFDRTPYSTYDSGVMYFYSYDTVNPRGYSMKRLELVKARPDGSIDYVIDFRQVFGWVDTMRLGMICDLYNETSDSSIVISAMAYEEGTSHIEYWRLKYNSRGVLTDSVRCANDTSYYQIFGEISGHRYIARHMQFHEFSVYDQHLRYVSSIPFPFPDYTNQDISAHPNEYGGVAIAYACVDTLAPFRYVGTDVLNLDSTMNYFPAAISGSVTIDSNSNCSTDSTDWAAYLETVRVVDTAHGDVYLATTGSGGRYNVPVPLGVFNGSHHTYSRFTANECGAFMLPVSTVGM
ncbi:MAG: hypothetical protein EBZ77_11970, partial [Chitinophagia bacterium]|nr:hypothetical protein [Chitinophagia bacterium]